MRRRNILAYSVLAMLLTSAALYLILNMTNPSSAGPAGILVVLLLIYGFSFGLMCALIVVFGYIYRLIKPRENTEIAAELIASRYAAARRRDVALGAVFAAMPILVISLNSIGRINALDVALIVATEAVATFYIYKKI